MSDAGTVREPGAGPPGVQSTGTGAVRLLAAVALAAALYFARPFFIPVVIGLLFAILFRPIVRALSRVRVPPVLGAALVVLGLLGALVLGGMLLSAPVRDWVSQAPRTLQAARAKLERIRGSVQRFNRAVTRAEQEAMGGPSRPGGAQAAPPQPQGPTLLARLFGGTTSLLGNLVEIVVVLFVALAAGDLLQRKLAEGLPPPARGTTDEVVDQVERGVTRYIGVTALINLGQAVAVGLVLWLLGMPNPALWGLATFVLEFVPFLGGVIMVGLLAIAALATFDGAGRALLAPASYLVISTIQNNVVSPFAYGSGLRLNPVAVLLAALFWYFLWGVPGALLAVPILVTMKIIADHSRRWTRFGKLVGD